MAAGAFALVSPRKRAPVDQLVDRQVHSVRPPLSSSDQRLDEWRGFMVRPGASRRGVGAALMGAVPPAVCVAGGAPWWVDCLVGSVTTVGSLGLLYVQARWQHQATVLVLQSRGSAESKAVMLRALLGHEDRAA